MAAPLVWVATELGRTHIFTGFPWVLLGYSQTTVLPIAQFASLFGVYGVSMLVASVSAAVAIAMFRPPDPIAARRARRVHAGCRRLCGPRLPRCRSWSSLLSCRHRRVGQPPRRGGRVDAGRRCRSASG